MHPLTTARLFATPLLSLILITCCPGCSSVRSNESALSDDVERLVDSMPDSKGAQRRAVSGLLDLGDPAVPYLVGHLGDVRPLPVRQMRLKNQAEDAFEAYRTYSPETVHDALAAILNDIAGVSFSNVVNGATPDVREINRGRWVEWCEKTYPSMAMACRGEAERVDGGGSGDRVADPLGNVHVEGGVFSGVLFRVGEPAQETGDVLDFRAESSPTEADLRRDIELVRDVPEGLSLRVVGFTDSKECAGSGCVGLSERRARALHRWLLANGAPEENLGEPLGMGATLPIGDNGTESGRAQNRRAYVSYEGFDSLHPQIQADESGGRR